MRPGSCLKRAETEISQMPWPLRSPRPCCRLSRRTQGQGKRKGQGCHVRPPWGKFRRTLVRTEGVRVHGEHVPQKMEHESLGAYVAAIDVAVRLDGIALTIAEPRGDLRDQLRRASASIPLNLAEGAAEFSPADKARFYRFARRSAAECAAIVDLAERISREPRDYRETKQALAELAAVLTGLVRAAEARKKP